MTPLKYEKVDSRGVKEINFEYFSHSGVCKHQIPGTIIFSNGTTIKSPLHTPGSLLQNREFLPSNTYNLF